MKTLVEEAVERVEEGVEKPREIETADRDLKELVEKMKTRILVVGTGGAGGNTITRIVEVGIRGADTIAINTDAQDLLNTAANRKILIGRELTGGLGAGSIPQIGEEAAHENENEIKSVLEGSDMVFITCGLGGGTGTGSAPVIAELATHLGALSVAVVTLPFTVEGLVRRENAEKGLDRLRKAVDTVIVIPNDRLLTVAPDLPLDKAFKVADEILMRAVKGVTELITVPGIINLDFADVRTVMEGGGVAMIGLGESDTEKRAVEAVEAAIKSPLLDVDITGARGALINVSGGEDLTIEESERIVETVSDRLDPRAQVIWGAQIREDLGRLVRVMLIVTGVESPQIFGPTEGREEKMERELGIEFLE